MKYRPFGKTGIEISAVSYGGIVSSGVHRSPNYPHENQQDPTATSRSRSTAASTTSTSPRPTETRSCSSATP